MTGKPAFLLVLAACTGEPPATSLADLQATFGATTLEVVARGQLAIEVHVARQDACPVLRDDLVATFDGQPMNVTRGGYDTDASGCYPIAFWFAPLPSASIAGWERSTAGSQLVVADPSATWRVDSTRLFANDFTIDDAAGTITWNDVPQISTAIVSPVVPLEIAGNVIAFPAGTAITYVDAKAHPVPARCDGPALCTVDLEGARDLSTMP